MTAAAQWQLLADYVSAAHKIARRLAVSLDRIANLFPLSASSISSLTEADEEKLDAFLHRFSSLAAAVQDHVGRALLAVEEEDLSETSRKDQRLLLEKLGAMDTSIAFGAIVELRNKLVHSYPDDPGKQAAILNLAFTRSADLLSGFNKMIGYSSQKFGIGKGLTVSHSSGSVVKCKG